MDYVTSIQLPYIITKNILCVKEEGGNFTLQGYEFHIAIYICILHFLSY